jgi:hypothetical protein
MVQLNSLSLLFGILCNVSAFYQGPSIMLQLKMEKVVIN